MSSVSSSGPPSGGGSDSGERQPAPSPVSPPHLLPQAASLFTPNLQPAPAQQKQYAGPLNLFVSKHAPTHPETLNRSPVKQQGVCDLRKHTLLRGAPQPTVITAATAATPVSKPETGSDQQTSPEQTSPVIMAGHPASNVRGDNENGRPTALAALGGEAPPVYKNTLNILRMLREAVTAEGPEAQAALQKTDNFWAGLEAMYGAIDTGLAKEKAALIEQLDLLTLEKDASTQAVQKAQHEQGRQVRTLTEALGKESQISAALQKTVQTTQSAYQKIKEELEHVQTLYKEQSTKFTQQTAEFGRIFKENGDLKIEISGLKAETSALKEKLKTAKELEATYQALDSKKTELERENKVLEDDLESVRKECSEACEKANKFQNETVKLNVKMKTFEEENVKMKSDIEKAKRELDNSNVQHQKLQHEHKELEMSQKKLADSYAALRAQGVTGPSSNANANADVSILEDKLQTAEAEKEKLAKTIQEWMKVGKDAFAKYQAINKDRDHLKATLSAEIASLKETVEKLKQSPTTANGDGSIDWKTKYEDLLRKVQRSNN